MTMCPFQLYGTVKTRRAGALAEEFHLMVLNARGSSSCMCFKQTKLGRGLSTVTSPMSKSNHSWPTVPISCHFPPRTTAQGGNIPDKLRLVLRWRGRRGNRRKERREKWSWGVGWGVAVHWQKFNPAIPST